MVRHHPVDFGGYRHCGSGDIMVLVFQVIWQDHVIQEPCWVIGRSLLS